MKCVLLLAAGLLASAPALAQERGSARDPAPVRATPFPDVPRGHWAFDAVEQMRQRGILRGYPPERKPERPKRSAARKQSRAHR
jgi:hypothetical protein